MSPPVGLRTRWPLIARDRELARIRAALDGDVLGVLLVGEAGAGSTHLARAASADYPATFDVSPTLEIDAHLIAAFTAARPPVVRISDAHDLDEAIAATLTREALGARARLLATARSGRALPASFEALRRDGDLAIVHVEPFDSAQVGEVLRAVLGGPVAGRTVGMLRRASRGNARYLHDLTVEALDDGALRSRDGVWSLGDGELGHRGLRDTIARELAALDDDERATLEIVALTEPAPLGLLRELVDPAALDRLEASGRLQLGADGAGSIRISHPVVGDAVRDLVPPGRRDILHGRIAATFPGAPSAAPGLARSLLWLLASGGEVPSSVLLEASTATNRLHDYDLAARLATAVLESGAVARERISALLQRSFALRFSGRPDEALDDAEVAAELAAEIGDAAARDAAATARADLLHYEHGDLDAALRALGGDGSAKIRTARLLHLGYGGRFGDLLAERETAGRGVAIADRIRIAAISAIATTFHGRPEAAMRLLARYAPLRWFARRDPWLAEEWSGAGFVALLHARGPTGVVRYLSSTLATVQDDLSMRFDDGVAQTGLSAILLEAGDIGAAVDAAIGAVRSLDEHDPTGFLQHALARAAHAHALAGHPEAAVEFADRARSAAPRSAAALGPDTTMALLWTSLAVDGPAVALPAIRRAAAGYLADDLPGAAAQALHLSLRAGDLTAAAELVALAPRLDGATNEARVAHARAVLNGDPSALHVVAEKFERLGATPAAAEIALAAEKVGDERLAASARRQAEAALDRLPTLRSPLLPERPRQSADAAVALTRREQEIGSMVARGASNREIARMLHLSLRTVEGHLGRIYSRLGLRGREELAARLSGE